MPGDGAVRPENDDASRFDDVAETYDAIRPRYPDAVFDAIRRFRRLPEHPQVLEAGIGTGQATVPMAARGWRVTGIEPGAKLAAVARERLARLRDVSVAAVLVLGRRFER